MVFQTKIAKDEQSWIVASLDGDITVSELISTLQINIVLIWKNLTKVYDLSDERSLNTPGTTVKLFSLRPGDVLYLYSAEYVASKGGVANVLSPPMRTIKRFCSAASEAFKKQKLANQMVRLLAQAAAGGASSSNQSLHQLLAAQQRNSEQRSQEQSRKSAQEVYDNMKNGRKMMYSLDAPELLEKFDADPGMSFETFQVHFNDFVKESERRARVMQLQPESEEGQRLIQQKIHRQKIDQLYEKAMDHHPEMMISVTMLYVKMEINGVPVKAFVDSGAQISIMSLDCAKRCNLVNQIDTRFQAKARGIGGVEQFYGKLHLCDVRVEDAHFLCQFDVMKNRAHDLLLGLNVLRSHNCCINLAKNRLEFANGTSTPFLQAVEIDAHLKDVVGIEVEGEAMDESGPSSSANKQGK